jgi:hypothetical protein
MDQMSTNILVGTDPELWASKDGKIVSAHNLIQGTKDKPFKVNKGAVQVDGLALEFNIDAASSEDEFCLNINEVLAQMQLMIPDHKLVVQPVAHFDMDYMKTQPKEALELGCDPDYNAWSGDPNPRPDGDRPFRTASGHVHIGWTSGQSSDDMGHISVCRDVVKQMDFYLGLPSLMYDADSKRREMYGKAGACRFKPYGVEYRTLSNAWLSDDARKKWVFRAVQAGVAAFEEGRLLADKYGDIQDIINNSDVKRAKAIIAMENLEVL